MKPLLEVFLAERDDVLFSDGGATRSCAPSFFEAVHNRITGDHMNGHLSEIKAVGTYISDTSPPSRPCDTNPLNTKSYFGFHFLEFAPSLVPGELGPDMRRKNEGRTYFLPKKTTYAFRRFEVAERCSRGSIDDLEGVLGIPGTPAGDRSSSVEILGPLSGSGVAHV
jgi:hypothetical protein